MRKERIKNDLERLDQLIRLKATGTPNDLAFKLSVSEATVYRRINMLREMGAKVSYCKIRRSYFYKIGFEFHV